jgi:hypothetical protein
MVVYCDIRKIYAVRSRPVYWSLHRQPCGSHGELLDGKTAYVGCSERSRSIRYTSTDLIKPYVLKPCAETDTGVFPTLSEERPSLVHASRCCIWQPSTGTACGSFGSHAVPVLALSSREVHNTGTTLFSRFHIYNLTIARTFETACRQQGGVYSIQWVNLHSALQYLYACGILAWRYYRQRRLRST